MRKIMLILILTGFLYAQKSDIDKEIIAPIKIALTGRAKLSNGFCEVKFPRKISEIIFEPYDIKVLIVPYRSWSGIYCVEINEYGFKCKSETGDLNAEFDYFVICKSKRLRTKIGEMKIRG
jgi:hypothetical protein